MTAQQPEESGHDVVVVGGCGHVGLPLAIALADRGASVLVYDVSEPAVALVNDGVLPFDEPGAADKLRAAVSSGRLGATTDPASVGRAEHVVIVIGTPVDEHLNPDPQAIPRALEVCAEHFHDGQLLVLRSTVFPGVTRLVERMVRERGLAVDVSFCPERIAEGRAMTELYALPQIVSGREARVRASPQVPACSRTRCSWLPSTTTTSGSGTPRCSSTRGCRSTS